MPDLVICDVRMPKMSGPALYDRAVAYDPRLAGRFLLVTGDSYGMPKAAAETSTPLTAVPLLRKPFTAADLDKALASLPAAN